MLGAMLPGAGSEEPEPLLKSGAIVGGAPPTPSYGAPSPDSQNLHTF